MKFAIYGVSRSGKDYFIENLKEYFFKNGKSLLHIQGSDMLNLFALNKYGVKFKDCEESQKITLREQFISYVNEMNMVHEYVVVDGHYAFYDSENNFNIVCTEYDLKCYEKFFYIDTDPNYVIERLRRSDGDKKNVYMTADQIQIWQNFEIDLMSKSLLSLNNESHIIKSEAQIAFEYVFDCVVKDKYNSFNIAKKMVKDLKINTTCVVLTDCDKTLSNEDSTSLALEFVGQSGINLKEIFKKDRYTNFQSLKSYKFLKEIKLYNSNTIDYVVEKITANQKIIDNLLALKNISIVGITASNGNVWTRIMKKFGLEIPILAHEQFIVSKYIKYFVVKELQAKGKYVIALGDSLLDGFMLKQANKGYIITTKGFRECLETFLMENPNIRQLEYLPLIYSQVLQEKSISTLKSLMVSNEVEKNISICKSNSGRNGRELRIAHYELGKEIAKMIQEDFIADKFCVISILRSGLLFSLGIADYFDCPIIFCDDKNFISFEEQLDENRELKDVTFIICDAVINSGKSISAVGSYLNGKKHIVATNVMSDKFNNTLGIPLYATRVSAHSFIGSKQNIVKNGKGPDTADRLFKLL